MTGRDDDRNFEPRRAAPALTIDYALYDKYLEESDLSEEERREFLDAMWSIIVDFVALGFEVHPAQQARKTCGQLPESRRNPPESGSDRVEWENSSRNDFEEAAGGRILEAAERIPK